VHEGFQETATTVKDDSCQNIIEQRIWFQEKINAVRYIAQDMSGAIYTTINIKNENMDFQYDNWEGNSLVTTKLGGPCTTNNTSPECVMLATPDRNINKYADLTGTNLLELARLKLLTLDTTLTQELATLNNTADLIGCPPDNLSTKQKTFNTSRDIGYIPTNTLRNALQELSPYYIDPSMLAVLLSYLITDPRFLTRLRTIPAEVTYINENIDAFYTLVAPETAASADMNKRANESIGGYIYNLKNYNTSGQLNGYGCGINGDYAQLSNAGGWI
jgi:hypothetical protein